MKRKSFVLLFVVLMMGVCCFAACGDDDDLKRAADRDEVRFVAVQPSGRIAEEDVDVKDFTSGITLYTLFSDFEVQRELRVTVDATDPSSPAVQTIFGLSPAANEHILVFCDDKAYAADGSVTRTLRGRTYYQTSGNLANLPFKGGMTYLFAIETNAA